MYSRILVSYYLDFEEWVLYFIQNKQLENSHITIKLIYKIKNTTNEINKERMYGNVEFFTVTCI